MSGISNSGLSAEKYYMQITGASKSKNKVDGDFCFGDDNGEIKEAVETINQVRAVKYIPLVVYNSKDNAWYVVPPNVIVNLVSKKKRGQHTENQFECATLSINKISAYQVVENNLKQETLNAIEEGRKHPELKIMMQNILADCKNMASKHTKQVSQLIDIIGETKINIGIYNSY